MANATVTVLEADGSTQTDVIVLDVGRQGAAASKSTTMCTEDKTQLDAIVTALQTIDNPDKGSGAIGSETQRVALATDSPGVTAPGQAAMAASLPVAIASDQTAVPASPTPATSGGLLIFRSLDLDETEEDVKTSAGQLYKLRIANFATSARYVKLYNATAANVTVGSTTPVDTIAVPPAAAAGNPTIITENFGGQGVAFGTALSMAATTALADADTGAPSANDVVVTAYYK